ncbi:oncostatin-M-specific receptor subunit beta-like [Stegodyphus dumicola]|uniref:oncostatin-M-specific receptor subunit beta-like n=1 Tax=Stegodyphus dumicola TaxID=202533 RepID=UPI0015ADAC1D|nr:oncostatin-M-specific receptor subunit beta-like [Stegodyphus dumicola]
MAEMFPKILKEFVLFGIFILQIFLITKTTCCRAIPHSRGNMTEDFDTEVGSPIRIRCTLFRTQLKLKNSTFNVSSKNLLIQHFEKTLDNVVSLDERTIEYFNPIAFANDTGCYACYVSVPSAKTKRFVCSTYIYVHMKPNAPLNATFSKVTATSLVFNWSSPSNMQYLAVPSGIEYTVGYRLAADPKSFREARAFFPEVAGGFVKYSRLRPYTKYEFEVRSKYVSDSEFMWSSYLTVPVRTLPDVPYLRPEITNSSFIIEATEITKISPDIRTVTLYWKSIPAAHENGPDFQYMIRISSQNRLQRTASVGNETSYSFEKLRVNLCYKFELFASNSVGPSSNISTIVIEADKLIDGPKEIIVRSDGSEYNIRWKAPEIAVKFYTLFWCERAVRRRGGCVGSLEWLHLSETKHVLKLSDSKLYQFAVSANTEDRTSGMVEASCHFTSVNVFSYAPHICERLIQIISANPSLSFLYI